MFRAIGKLIKFIFSLVLIVVLVVVLVLGYARFIEPKLVKVNELEYESTSIKEPVTVAIFADTHFGFDYTASDFEKAIDKINANPPDILLFAGDLIDNLSQFAGSTSEISDKLSKLKANDGKYAVFGNHDYGGGAEHKYEDIMENGGFQVLVNESVPFNKYNLRLIGIDDLLIGYGNPAIALNASSNMYNLVLCHEPDIFDKLVGSNTNLMTAGHTHGGQIQIPFYTEQFLPSYGEKYVKGEYTKENITLNVNAGLGTTKLPARFMAVPEITYITISPQ